MGDFKISDDERDALTALVKGASQLRLVSNGRKGQLQRKGWIRRNDAMLWELTEKGKAIMRQLGLMTITPPMR